MCRCFYKVLSTKWQNFNSSQCTVFPKSCNWSLEQAIWLWNKKKLLACGWKNVLLQMESSCFANYTLISFLTGDEDLWVLWWLSPLCISCTLYHGKHYVLFCCEVRINWYQANENSIDVDRLLTIFDMKSKVGT